jgi:amidophosphoribosyltransferase
MWPCFYGIDFASRAELIASGLGVEEIRASIGADSLAFVSLEGLTAASNQPANNLCRACFTGEYPIEIPQPDLIGKHVLEGLVRNASAAQSAEHIVDHAHADNGLKVVHNGGDGVDSMDSLLVAGGAEDALGRP